jgi:hypothetical protein
VPGWGELRGLVSSLPGDGAARKEMGLRDTLQRLVIANRDYGYRRSAVLPSQGGWRANHKHVLRLMPMCQSCLESDVIGTNGPAG